MCSFGDYVLFVLAIFAQCSHYWLASSRGIYIVIDSAAIPFLGRIRLDNFGVVPASQSNIFVKTH